MSSSFDEPVGSQASVSMALLPSKPTQQNQKEYTNAPELTALQQRKRDAIDIAELIYNIYNSNCPISLDEKQKGQNDV